MPAVGGTLSTLTPGGEKLLKEMQSLAKGDVMTSPFLQGLKAEMAWTCLGADAKNNNWTLEGTFLGIPVMKVQVILQSSALRLMILDPVGRKL
jgi:hypothetical protein